MVHFVKQSIKFSIIVVSLNAGRDLIETVDSILDQNYSNYEIVLKDGLSSDDALAKIPNIKNIKIIIERDIGIYDAMNQAIKYCSGEYILFLNCGDLFFNELVLEKMNSLILAFDKPEILYGDYFNKKHNHLIYSPQVVTKFYLYRTVLCHQACFFKRELFEKYGKFDLTFKVFADYELLVRMVVGNNVKPVYSNIVISFYKGGGYSERIGFDIVKRFENNRIRSKYFTKFERLIYFIQLQLSLPRLRMIICRNKYLNAYYIKLINWYYKNN